MPFTGKHRQSRPRAGPRLVLVVGPRNSGKTEYARIIVQRARAAGLRVAGYLSEAEWDGTVKARFFLHDVSQTADGPGQELRHRPLLASVTPAPGLDLRAGPYYLNSAAFHTACDTLRAASHSDLICVDEVGPLELRGSGFYPALEYLLNRYKGILVLTARPAIAARIHAGAGLPMYSRSLLA